MNSASLLLAVSGRFLGLNFKIRFQLAIEMDAFPRDREFEHKFLLNPQKPFPKNITQLLRRNFFDTTSSAQLLRTTSSIQLLRHNSTQLL